jgi:hypothetical protein
LNRKADDYAKYFLKINISILDCAWKELCNR